MSSMLPESEAIEDFVLDELRDFLPNVDDLDEFIEKHGTDLINSFEGAIGGSFGSHILHEYTKLFRELYEEVSED